MGPPDGIPLLSSTQKQQKSQFPLPFKKALGELLVLARNPHPPPQQTCPPFPASAAVKPISNSNNTAACDEDSSQTRPQAMEEQLET